MSGLFDDVVPTPKAQQRAAQRERKDAGLQRVLEAYYERFAERFKFPPVKNYPAHKRMLKPIFDSWGEAETDAALALFLATTDPRVTTGYQPDYTIQHFLRVAQYLRVADVSPIRDSRLENNAEAVRRAVGGRKK